MQELRQLRDPYDEEQAELPVYGHALRPRHRGGSETCGAAESQPYGRYPLRKTSQEAQARLQRQPALVRALDSLQAVRVAQVKEAKRTRRRQRPGREEILDLRTFLLVTGYRTLSLRESRAGILLRFLRSILLLASLGAKPENRMPRLLPGVLNLYDYEEESCPGVQRRTRHIVLRQVPLRRKRIRGPHHHRQHWWV